MKKRAKRRKFNREKDQRRALLKSLASSLILKEKIETTEAKAKEISSYTEKLITVAKKGDLSARRSLACILKPNVVKKTMNEIAPRFKERKGGYTRVIKLGRRLSDGSKMAFIELLK
jgi:large subunit ribosomal protein L17